VDEAAGEFKSKSTDIPETGGQIFASAKIWEGQITQSPSTETLHLHSTADV
jgi:hypothetical protein